MFAGLYGRHGGSNSAHRRTTPYIRGAGEVLLAGRKKLGVGDGEKALGKVQVLLPRKKGSSVADKLNLAITQARMPKLCVLWMVS